MKPTKILLAAVLAIACGVGSAKAEVRTWTDVQGRQVTASFVQLDGENIVVQTPDGAQHRFPLARLTPEDQALAKSMQTAAAAAPAATTEGEGAAPQMLANATVAQAAQAVDKLVAGGLVKANPDRVKNGKAPITKFNAMANDEQFVRRLYLDVAGRIPNYEEALAFIKDTAPDKRAKLIDTLLDSEGYRATMYNYLAEMLRIKDKFEQDNVRGTPYIAWVKEQIAQNRPWDQVVYDMLTADGKMWHNGAAGYLLRDAGMPLDNLANTLTVFLGTDVACAQCHDHPFADWTQKQFFEMASFFGATTTRLNGKDIPSGDPRKRLMPEIESIIGSQSGLDIRRLRNGIENYISANQVSVKDRTTNEMKLPHDYKYKDGKPNDPVAPKFVMWDPAKDKGNPAYKQSKKNEEKLRTSFANWLTHPQNPRFAMTIANRMWKRAFGSGVAEPVTNIDDPEQSANPALIKHLAEEMKRVKFDLKQFMRIVYNTRAYQSEATTENIALGERYYFQGPMLRRMSAEQAWDSYMTLVLGQPDGYKAPLQDLYSKAIDMNLDTVDAKTVLIKYNAYRGIEEKERALMGGGLEMAGADMMMDGKKDTKAAAAAAPAMNEPAKILTYGNMRLMRAAEIQQPAPGGHFLIDFGQSPRNLIDGSTKIGNVPQVLMMMNGKAQEMLTNSDSLVFRTMNKVNNPSDKVERMFLTIMSRKPTLQEKEIAKRELNSHGEEGYGNMIWALINTREFMFVQ